MKPLKFLWRALLILLEVFAVVVVIWFTSIMAWAVAGAFNVDWSITFVVMLAAELALYLPMLVIRLSKRHDDF